MRFLLMMLSMIVLVSCSKHEHSAPFHHEENSTQATEGDNHDDLSDTINGICYIRSNAPYQNLDSIHLYLGVPLGGKKVEVFRNLNKIYNKRNEYIEGASYVDLLLIERGKDVSLMVVIEEDDSIPINLSDQIVSIHLTKIWDYYTVSLSKGSFLF